MKRLLIPASYLAAIVTEKRYRYAHSIGCDSADGTYLTFGPDVNLPKLLTWARIENQHQLFEVTA